jgi:hypothetical protein
MRQQRRRQFLSAAMKEENITALAMQRGLLESSTVESRLSIGFFVFTKRAFFV